MYRAGGLDSREQAVCRHMTVGDRNRTRFFFKQLEDFPMKRSDPLRSLHLNIRLELIVNSILPEEACADPFSASYECSRNTWQSFAVRGAKAMVFLSGR
jgi:hypothetical protein